MCARVSCLAIGWVKFRGWVRSHPYTKPFITVEQLAHSAKRMDGRKSKSANALESAASWVGPTVGSIRHRFQSVPLHFPFTLFSFVMLCKNPNPHPQLVKVYVSTLTSAIGITTSFVECIFPSAFCDNLSLWCSAPPNRKQAVMGGRRQLPTEVTCWWLFAYRRVSQRVNPNILFWLWPGHELSKRGERGTIIDPRYPPLINGARWVFPPILRNKLPPFC